MSEKLISVGLEVVSELEIENRAGSFAVPEMEIQSRTIRYKSPVHFTPLLRGELVDAGGLREIVDQEYEKAGITKNQVDTCAIIITGETSRKENARAVLDALSAYAGDFVVATAGPDLESVRAAKGAGAVAFSRKTGKTVLHMDIGGGTSNLALIEDGVITATTCLNVGGRLVKLEPGGRIAYVSPALAGIFEARVGETVTREAVLTLAGTLAQGLEMAAGLREKTALLEKLETREAASSVKALAQRCEGRELVISFSGGVADCIEKEIPWLAFGDMGPELGKAIRESRLCAGMHMMGEETIRATVIGAGCHSAQLSGSTVFRQNVRLPLKNIPVVHSKAALLQLDEDGVLALPGEESCGYEQVATLAAELAEALRGRRILLALERDAAKALGQQLALRLGREAEILCIDRVRLEEGSFLDVGVPVGPAIPLVVKTLILSQ